MLKVPTAAWFLLLLAVTSATQFECIPYPIKGTCVIDSIYYHPNGEHVSFPTGYDHYRLMYRPAQIKSNVSIFDGTLYEAMHRPSRIEMANIYMNKLILPPELQLGNFAENGLYAVIIEAGRDCQISYLDLEGNYLTNITFLSSLVNLEVLHLSRNHISTIPGSAFGPLTKLKYFYLQHNRFKSIPWTDLPQSLIHLDCTNGQMESADFTNVSLPSLEYLELQHNPIPTINVTALLQVAPILKEAQLQNEKMTEHELDQIKDALRSNNISFIDVSWPKFYCEHYDDYQYEDGKCVRQRPELVGTGMAILLSGVIIGVAAAFIYIVVLAFRHMNR